MTSQLRLEEQVWQKEKLQNCSEKPGEQWQQVLGWLGWKNGGSPSQLFFNGKLINKPLEIANCLNKYFIDKVENIFKNIPSQVSDPLEKLKNLMKNRTSVFKLKTVHPDDIELIMRNLKNSKSAGLDTIDSQIIKLSLPYILPAVTHVINLSIVNCHFPSQWKVAKIIPLHKKDDHLNPKNYRPVAILPVLSKY